MTETLLAPDLHVSLAQSEEDLRAAQTLRYQVFVTEFGASGPLVDHAERLERDAFDPFADHLILRDHARPGSPVVGVYRLLRQAQAQAAGGFYSESEFDLTPLLRSGRPLLELGRSCLHPDYRGGAGLMHLWQGLTRYVAQHGSEVLFGVASLKGTQPEALAHPLSWLHHHHRAASALRPVSREICAMDVLSEADVDRKRAMLEMPALIKSYLRLGGVVGDGGYIDRAFRAIDVCMVLDVTRIPPAKQAMLMRTDQ